MITGDAVNDWLLHYLVVNESAPIKALIAWLQHAWFSYSSAQVYNKVNSLLESKLLTKTWGKIRLSAWRIESIISTAERLQQQRDRDGIVAMYPGEKKSFTAKSFHELNAIRHDISVQLLRNYQWDVYYYDLHPYHMLGEPSIESSDFSQAKKENASLYYLLWGDSVLDRHGSMLATQAGAMTYCLAQPLFSDKQFVAVIGEYVYEIVLDAKVVSYFELFFRNIQRIEDFDQKLFYDLFAMKGEFSILLQKNSDSAQYYRSTIHAYFLQ